MLFKNIQGELKSVLKMLKISPYHVLLIVSLLDMFSIGLIMPQLTNHAISLGASHITIGFMGALYSASQLISAPVIGSLSDLRGRKPIFLLCLSICCVCYAILGITSSIFIFLLLRVILGLTKQTQLLAKAITPDYVKDSKNQAVLFGRQAALAGVGMTLGPILGGYIVEAYPNNGFTVLTTIMGIIFLINLALINSLPDIEVKTEKKEDDKMAIDINAITPTLIDSIKKPLKESIDEFYKIDWTIFGDIFVYKLLITLCMMMYFGSFGLFIQTVHNISPKNLGYLISVQAITGSLCNFFIGYINHLYKNDNDFTQRNFHVFIGVTLSLVGLALAPNIYLFIVLLVPLAITTSVGRIVTLEMVTNRATDDRRGTVIGASNSIKSLSGVVTPLISGLVNQYLGVKYGFLIAASFTGIGVVISYRTRSRSLEAKNK